MCTCSTGFIGSTCEACGLGHIAYPTCAACNVGSTDPACTQCTIAAHCSSHAASVTLNVGNISCACTCSIGFAGTTCDVCNVSYITYPTCTQCTTATHCSSHAASVTSNGDNTACACNCSTGFTGTTCNTCGVGYTKYPTCRLKTRTSSVTRSDQAGSIEDKTRSPSVARSITSIPWNTVPRSCTPPTSQLLMSQPRQSRHEHDRHEPSLSPGRMISRPPREQTPRKNHLSPP